MTARPPLGAAAQRQPPPRTISGSGMSQRPATHQRSLSQQFLPSSPIRTQTFPDFGSSAFDAADVAQGRHGSARRGGSRLKVELSSESIIQDDMTESPNAMDSSKPFTPSRMMPLTEPSDLGDMSPRPSTQAQTLDINLGPMPMPKRRQRFTAPTSFRPPQSIAAPPPKKDARPKPYSIETPSAASQYRVLGKPDSHNRSASGVGSGSAPVSVAYADFVPWTGNHPEDQFSEYVIRNGFFDKAPIAQTETASAKQAVFPSLKHKTGIQALSHILAGVLAHRRYGGQIKSASTFKPPPRVTLTDTKREVWLKDLANPAISLRRLSRTIPHGIRGKILLDQCLNKNVPTDRAVWLAKCVGANEIRAFKRKGVNGALVMGGETKWIRDWTISVEQFVDSVMLTFGDAEWKAKVNYAIRLATHFYAEYLLDREHYMEWLLSGLENSTQSKLPMWIIISQIYWKDLLCLRRMARRLVAALLTHLQAIRSNPDGDILFPLSSRISSLLGQLCRDSPLNFVGPSAWAKYGDILISSQPANDEVTQGTLKVLAARNERLLVAAHGRSQPASRHVLIGHLDAALHAPIPDELPADCWKLSQDKDMLGRVLLEWCASLHRPSPLKVYVAARYLRAWSTLRFDVSGAIFGLLDSDSLVDVEQKAPIYHLVSELVRSGHFSIPRYLQWIIARGGLSSRDEVDAAGPCALRLLVELPIEALTESQRQIRASLLRRASFPWEQQDQDTVNAIGLVQRALEGDVVLSGSLSNGKAIRKLSKRIGLSSRALKTQVASWVRQFLHFDDDTVMTGAASEPECPAPLFNSVRMILEACEDYKMLGEVVATVTQVSNVDVLASCADTLSRHFLVFSALGVAEELFQGLLAKLKMIVETQGLFARPLLASLANLAPRLPGLEDLAAQLNRDLAQSDRNTGVDACSPVSDNMAGRLQEESGDLQEEMEKLLANGTSLDSKTMNRLFATIATRLQCSWEKAPDQQRAYCALLTRLRIFDTQHFDSLMTNWIREMRDDQSRSSVLVTLPVLISDGCLTLATVLAAASLDVGPTASGTKAPPSSATPSASSFLQALQGSYHTRFMQEILVLMVKTFTPNELLTLADCYRLAIFQQQTVIDKTAELLSLTRNALAEYSLCKTLGDLGGLPLDQLEIQNALVRLLRSLVLRDAPAVAKALASRTAQELAIGPFVEPIVTKLLLPGADTSTQVSFEQILQLTNDFTLPFCQLKLSMSLVANEESSPDGSDRSQTKLELFVRAMDNAIDAGNIGWAAILPSLSPEITHHVKNRAQSRFLTLIPSLRTSGLANASGEQAVHKAQTLLSVIDTIIRGNGLARPQQLVPAIIDKLIDLWELLAYQPSTSGEDGITDNAPEAARAAVLGHWLPLLLDFVTQHAPSFDSSRAANELRARAALVLAGLMQELDQQPLLAERTFDLAAMLADNLAEDARLQCVRAVKDISADPRLRYLFSFAAQPAESLMLAHRSPPTAAAPRSAGAVTSGVPATATSAAAEASTTPGMAKTQPSQPEKLVPFTFRRWEILNEPTPNVANVGENDTSLNLMLFEARKIR